MTSADRTRHCIGWLIAAGVLYAIDQIHHTRMLSFGFGVAVGFAVCGLSGIDILQRCRASVFMLLRR